MATVDLPLSGIRVLDLSRILAGPVCTQLLADLGADVVKVERPGAGDDTRHWGPPFLPNDGASAYFLACNRGKRSIALDLNQPAARLVLDELIESADVLVENFLPGDVEKFGLAPARLARLNPRLVSCSISGYGRTGPMANVPGYDLMIQGLSGLMSITGEPDGPPMKIGVAMSDVVAGLYAAISVLAGLQARERGQPGASFDLALLDCTLASLVNVAQSTLITGEKPARYGNAHPQIVPYEAFATADGHLVVGIGNDGQFQRLCRAIGRDDLSADPYCKTNPLRVEHRETLVAELRAAFATRSTEDWLSILSARELPHAPVLPLDEALKLPQVTARNMIVEVEDGEGRRFRLLNTPINWPGRPANVNRIPPGLGEHTEEVLREWLGQGDQEIASLREQNALG